MWAATTTFSVGQMLIGVRSSSVETDRLLRELLADRVVDPGGAPPNYSLLVTPPAAKARARPQVHQLFRSSHAVTRSRSAARTVRALVAHLSAIAAPPPEELLVLRAVGLIGADGTAVLAPATVTDDLARVEPRLRRQGLRLVDGPHALVDPATAELVVASPTLTMHPAALDRLAAWEELEGSEQVVAPGRYPLAAWALVAGEPHGPMPASSALAWAYPTVVRAGACDVQAALGRLRRLLSATTAHSVTSALPSLTGQLGRLARPR